MFWPNRIVSNLILLCASSLVRMVFCVVWSHTVELAWALQLHSGCIRLLRLKGLLCTIRPSVMLPSFMHVFCSLFVLVLVRSCLLFFVCFLVCHRCFLVALSFFLVVFLPQSSAPPPSSQGRNEWSAHSYLHTVVHNGITLVVYVGWVGGRKNVFGQQSPMRRDGRSDSKSAETKKQKRRKQKTNTPQSSTAAPQPQRCSDIESLN